MKTVTVSASPRRVSGFTLVEAMVTITIVGLVMTIALKTFVDALLIQYKDYQRLSTDGTLRYFIAQVAKQTLDASEFYVFPTYQSLDGAVNLTTDPSTQNTDNFNTYIGEGDCLVLVTRVNTDIANSVIQRFRIYYRVATSPDTQAPIRYYDSGDVTSSAVTAVATLLNGVNLSTTPNITGSTQIVANCRGRLRTNYSGTPSASSSPYYHPIFATESSTSTAVDTAVSINVEIINGTTTNNMLSSSSFNYTISPRK